MADDRWLIARNIPRGIEELTRKWAEVFTHFVHGGVDTQIAKKW